MRSSPRSSARSIPTTSAPATSPCSPARTPSCPGSCAPSRPPGSPCSATRSAPGTPLATATRAATVLTSASRLRAWAHDTLEVEPGDRARRAGDGRATRRGRRPRVPPRPAARRRRRAADVVGDDAPVRRGRRDRGRRRAHVPRGQGPRVARRRRHGRRDRPRARTARRRRTAARAEEARLLHVAVTRPADRLVITWAARRGGYARRPSPLIADIDTGEVELAPPPPELRSEPADARPHARRASSTWRADAARAAGILPEELCSDRDLHAIAGRAPDDARGARRRSRRCGLLTARRLLSGARAPLLSAT